MDWIFSVFVEWLQVLMSERKIALGVYRLTFDFNSFNLKKIILITFLESEKNQTYLNRKTVDSLTGFHCFQGCVFRV